MPLQKFYASETTLTCRNGAVGHSPGGPFDCLGPYAKVRNCPIHGTELRVTAYATGYADSSFSVPAATRVRGRYVAGYFTHGEDGIEFRPLDKYKDRLQGT